MRIMQHTILKEIMARRSNKLFIYKFTSRMHLKSVHMYPKIILKNSNFKCTKNNVSCIEKHFQISLKNCLKAIEVAVLLPYYTSLQPHYRLRSDFSKIKIDCHFRMFKLSIGSVSFGRHTFVNKNGEKWRSEFNSLQLQFVVQ